MQAAILTAANMTSALVWTPITTTWSRTGISAIYQDYKAAIQIRVGMSNPTKDITHCYNFSYFVLFTYVFSLFLEVSHGAATLTHFSLTHIAATLLTDSIAILIVLPHWCSIYSGQSCRLFFS